MSIPDHWIEQPEYCVAHGFEQPCWKCWNELEAERLAEQFEDRLDERETNP